MQAARIYNRAARTMTPVQLPPLLLMSLGLAAAVVAAPADSSMRDHPIAGPTPAVLLDGEDWMATHHPPRSLSPPTPPASANFSAWLNLLPLDRNNFTGSLTGLSECSQACSSQGRHCVGFTLQGLNCWLYAWVPSLTATGAQGVTYFSKRSVPVPPHPIPPPPAPPSPPPPPAPPRLPIAASVPGDILTDLQRAGVTGDPYWNQTWLDPKYIAKWNSGCWSYTKQFATPQAGQEGQEVLLILDGIKMGAMIELNGHRLGNATDQFIRYVFDVGHLLLQSGPRANGSLMNELNVTFGAELMIATDGRYTHSAQIDWAPGMTTIDPAGKAKKQPDMRYFGFGIWKSVYLVPLPAGSAAFSQLVVHPTYAGSHPTNMLTDDAHAGFDVTVRAELYAASGVTTGTLAVTGSWPNAEPVSQQVRLTGGGLVTNNVTVTIPASQTVGAALWHPHGHGKQALHNVTATFTPHSARPTQLTSRTWRRTGLRDVALVTVNDTDPHVVASGGNGTGYLTMFFRVNGAPVYVRGANKVQMDLMDGRMSGEAHRRLVQSAVEGNFNMLRVWGQGIWEPRAFHDACDEMGVLLYSDSQIEPIYGTAQEHVELDYQIKRLSHHPSIVLWDGCNECGGGGAYTTWGMAKVAQIDQSRPVWPACPANGWLSGAFKLNSRPNLGQLELRYPRTTTNRFLWPQESHGPYTAFMGNSVSGDVMPRGGPGVWSPDGSTKRPTASPAYTGPAYEGWYKSEFGCTVWPSFESISAQLPKEQWSMSSAAAAKRNWNVANVIGPFFGANATAAMRDSGEQAFKRQLYQSMISQVLYLKTQIESWRSQNIWGNTFWMYNEIWATGGWGSIEYGSPVPGQVVGGRWKPTHYVLRASTFADQLCVCTVDGSCFVANDSPFAFTGTATVRVLNVISGASSTIVSRPLSLPPGPRLTQWFCGTGNLSGGEDVARLDVNGRSRSDTVNATYTLHRRQIPDPSGNFTKELQAASELACEAACNAEPTCLGFTSMPSLQLTTCWLYSSAPRLENNDAWWWQKPGTPHIPAPPPPPAPPPLPKPAPGPPLLKCADWNATTVWKAIGCAASGENCVLDIRVNRSSGEVASWSTVPFRAPKDMALPAAAVNVTVADKPSPGAETVDVVLTTNATAIYVVLTTQAAGRFADNVMLLEAGVPRSLAFLAWGELDYDLLKSSLRVEHLAENLASALVLKSDDVVAAVEPLFIGTVRQLFAADVRTLLDLSRTTAQRTVHTFDGGDHPQTVLRTDLPSESGKSLDTFSVLYDEKDGKVKIWYMIGTDCGYHCNVTDDQEDGLFAYAESEDGITFTKPAVGENGTNVLGFNTAGPSVFLNNRPGAPPSQRFVSVGECHGRPPMCTGGWAWMTSRDGITWPKRGWSPSSCTPTGSIDTVATTFWDPSISAYASYTRDRYGTGNSIRRVRRLSTHTLGAPGASFSRRTCPWTNSTVVIDIDTLDNATHPDQVCAQKWPPWATAATVDPPLDLYGAVVWRREMDDGDSRGWSSVLYWAFPWRFYHYTGVGLPGTYDIGLLVSRDSGSNFSYVDQERRRPFVRTGRDGTAGSRRVRMAPSPVVLPGGTMLFYLYMSNEAEAPRVPTDGGKPAAASIGVLRMRLDGFVSFGSTHYAQPASIRTQPLRMSGHELRVNVDSISGAMRVAIMDPTRQDPSSGDLAVFPGFGLNQSIVLSSNSVNATVSWTNASVSSLVGKPLVLHFELMEAELYSFQFAKSTVKTDDGVLAARALVVATRTQTTH